MRKQIRRFFLRLASRFEDPSGEQFGEGYEDLPDADKRSVMTPLALAQLIVGRDKNSAGFIVLEHELNLKIAKEQSKATLIAGWLGAGATIIAVVLAAAMGYYIGNSKPEVAHKAIEQPTTTCNCTQNVTAPLPDKNEKQTSEHRTEKPKP